MSGMLRGGADRARDARRTRVSLWRVSRPVRAGRISSGARMAAVALVAAVGLLLTACQAIPDSGPVREGLTNLDQVDQPVQFNPGGPAQGASQEDIVRGFVRAASSASNDYEIAREFLTPAYAQEWNPLLGVLVDQGTQEYTDRGGNIGVLELAGVAAVDDQGTLTPIPPGTPTEVRFELERVNGQWRIASAPAGIILDRSTFQAVWSPKQLAFLSPDDRIVPETRWYLNRATLATQLVAGLLAGPSPEMVGAVRTAFPAGTKLASSSVPVQSGTARIDLTPELLQADQATMLLIKRQIAATLQAVPGVTRFELTVTGGVIDSGTVTAADPGTPANEHPSVAVLQHGVFGVVSGNQVKPLAGVGEQIAALDARFVDLATDEQSAVVRSPAGVSWVGGAEPLLLDTRLGLINPDYDRFGYVWSYATATPDQVLVVKPGGQSQLVHVPWLAGRTPTAIRVSRSGTRLAILVNESGQSAVLVTGVSRDASGQPIGLGKTATTELWASGTPLDIDWIDEQRFAVLTRAGTNSRIAIGAPGNFSSEAGSVSGGVSLGGGGSRALLRVLDGSGRLFTPQGSGWQVQLSEVTLVAKSG